MKVFILYCFIIPVLCDLNPFLDSDLFDIYWAGPNKLENLDENVEIVSLQTADNEKYQCVLPESQASREAHRKASYTGPSPEKIMEQLFLQNTCSYRLESYWTYELCHGKHIKQYHENKELGLQKPKLQEYFLGLGHLLRKEKGSVLLYNRELILAVDTVGTAEEENTDKEEFIAVEYQVIEKMKIDGLELPYFSVNMSDGTVCDLTGKPRRSNVLYICQPDGRGEIYQMKETSSCEYDIIVLTYMLCAHPDFKPKDPPVNKINCHPVEGAPTEPNQAKHLTQQTLNAQVLLDDPEDKEEDILIVGDKPSEKIVPPRDPVRQQTPQPPLETGMDIGITADKQLLREFLNGDYCFHGGSGWWKHEFCYGKHAKQYHDEKDLTSTVYLGYWDRAKHVAWLQSNPQKAPKPVGQRKQLSLHYSNGETCDLTGQKRVVEVKLKCLNQPNHPHAVQIYLVEPKTCEYILGVESPIFCDLLDKADEFGLLDNVEL